MSGSNQYDMNLPFFSHLPSFLSPPPACHCFFFFFFFSSPTSFSGSAAACAGGSSSPPLPGAPLPLLALRRLALGEQLPLIEVHSMLGWKTGLLFRKSLITSPPPERDGEETCEVQFPLQNVQK